jgi:hypothetical protein
MHDAMFDTMWPKMFDANALQFMWIVLTIFFSITSERSPTWKGGFVWAWDNFNFSLNCLPSKLVLNHYWTFNIKVDLIIILYFYKGF